MRKMRPKSRLNAQSSWQKIARSQDGFSMVGLAVEIGLMAVTAMAVFAVQTRVLTSKQYIYAKQEFVDLGRRIGNEAFRSCLDVIPVNTNVGVNFNISTPTLTVDIGNRDFMEVTSIQVVATTPGATELVEGVLRIQANVGSINHAAASNQTKAVPHIEEIPITYRINSSGEVLDCAHGRNRLAISCMEYGASANCSPHMMVIRQAQALCMYLDKTDGGAEPNQLRFCDFEFPHNTAQAGNNTDYSWAKNLNGGTGYTAWDTPYTDATTGGDFTSAQADFLTTVQPVYEAVFTDHDGI